MAIVRYTLEEALQLPSLTDWERVKNMRDEDIDYSDIPELDDGWFARTHMPEQAATEDLEKARRVHKRRPLKTLLKQVAAAM
ncbi:MAG: hypothetical protein LBS94_02015 [Prevotellaceae bacterium]|jgi:hypothetical protein|nr:hypothetical protein [Prevotellaceae bacterium]